MMLNVDDHLIEMDAQLRQKLQDANLGLYCNEELMQCVLVMI